MFSQFDISVGDWGKRLKAAFSGAHVWLAVVHGYICGQGAELVMCIICSGLWSTAALCGQTEWIIWCLLMWVFTCCSLNAENPSALLFIVGINGSN